ncbi:MAG: helix-turn-helix domain-containing protein [Candidatus Freyarchaeota archaeon]
MDAIDRLVSCGLTEKEAELYLTLLRSRNGCMSAREISNVLDYSRQMTYRLLTELIQKGFVRQTLERPRRYIAVSPVDALDSLINVKKQQITQLEKIKPGLEDLLSSLDTREVENPEFRLIHNRQNIYSAMADIALRAKKSIDLLTDEKGLYLCSLFGLTDIFNEISKNGVYVRLLTKVTRSNADTVKNLNPRIRIKHGFHPDQNILIADEKSVLTFIQTNDAKKMRSKADSAFFTTSSTFIIQQKNIFNYFWENALDIKTRLAEIGHGEEYQIQPLIGERNLIKKMAELVKKAENEILAFFSGKYLTLYKARFLNFIRDENIPGEIIYLLLPPNYPESEKVDQLLSLGINLRHVRTPRKWFLAEDPLPRMAVYDGKSAVVMLEDVPDSPALDAGFWTTHKSYVSKLREKFFEVWKHSKPVTRSKEQYVQTEYRS